MTAEQMIQKYRRHWLGFLAESWACRKLPPSEFGALVDLQTIRMEEIIKVMVAELIPKQTPSPPSANGPPTPSPTRKA